MSTSTTRIQRVRRAEKLYHEKCFEQHRLFQQGSWLDKPVQIIIDLLAQFDLHKSVQVLDLGSGVGRHSIPLAKLVKAGGGRVVCVDILEKALQMLKQYSETYGVADCVAVELADVSEYAIPEHRYDYIVAAACLEHAKSEAAVDQVLERMANGTKPGGVNYICMNTNVHEIDVSSGKERETLFEILYNKDQAIAAFRRHYQGWEELHVSVEPLELPIVRDQQPVLLKADHVSYAVQRSR